MQSVAAAIVVMSGSSYGADAFAADFARLAREHDAGFIAVLWVAAVAKLLVGLLALAPARRWGRRLPRRPLTMVTSAVGTLILVYGIGSLLQAVLMKTGVVAVPAGLGAKALSWHLRVWDPYWTLGGVLFLLAARATRRPEKAGA